MSNANRRGGAGISTHQTLTRSRVTETRPKLCVGGGSSNLVLVSNLRSRVQEILSNAIPTTPRLFVEVEYNSQITGADPDAYGAMEVFDPLGAENGITILKKHQKRPKSTKNDQHIFGSLSVNQRFPTALCAGLCKRRRDIANRYPYRCQNGKTDLFTTKLEGLLGLDI